MRKEIYLIRGERQEKYGDFESRIVALARKVADHENPPGLKLTVTAEAPPVLSVIPFSRKKLAVISVFPVGGASSAILKDAQGFAGAFLVEEALPVAYERTWAPGTPTPGPCLLTLFHRRPGIDQATFLDRWHYGHTPLSLKLHPLWHYNRNVVLEKLSDHPSWYDGIVEELTRTRAELLNPFKFFGRPHRVIQNMLAVYTDTRSFLDYRRIETYLTREIIVK